MIDIIQISEQVVDLVVQSNVIAFVAVDQQGPMGPPGVSGNVPLEIEVTAAGGEQTIRMPPNFGLLNDFFVNGLRQRPSVYSVAGALVTTPDDLVAGDILSLVYSPA